MDKAILTQLRRQEAQLTAMTRMIAQLRAIVESHGQAIADLERVVSPIESREPLVEDDGLGDLPARDRRALRKLDEEGRA
jgi:hypothetical protein